MVRQLLKKELQIQKSSLYFVAAIGLVWAIMLGLATQGDQVLIPRQLTMGQLVSLLQTFFVAPCLLVIVPLLVGATMVAEERKLGVWDWQLSLPAARWLQWLVKLALGVVITLGVFITQLLLEAMMVMVLDARGGPYPLTFHYLGLNHSYVLLPLLLMASAGFASSLASDPYRAFFGGVIVIGFILVCTYFSDPAGLMFLPWPENEKVSWIWNSWKSNIAWVVIVSAIVAWCAWFNIRYEGLKWRRLGMEMTGIALLVSSTTLLIIHLGYSPRWVLSQGTEDLKSYIQKQRAWLGLEAQDEVEWHKIEPLLAIDLRPGLLSSRKKMTDLLAQRTLFANLYRFGQSERLLIEAKSIPLRENTDVPLVYWNQIIDFDMATNRYRAIPQVIGRVGALLPEQDAFTIESSRHNTYVVTDWPAPIRVGGILWEVWKYGNQVEVSGSRQVSALISTSEVIVDGVAIESTSSRPVHIREGLYQIYLEAPSGKETWLIQQEDGDNWQLADRQPGFTLYRASSDGQWFTPDFSKEKEIRIYSLDKATSWTIESPSGNLFLTGDVIRWTDDVPMGASALGSSPAQIMPVSASGRFLAFMRTKNIELEDWEGKLRDTGYPMEIEIGVLDLERGDESVLVRRAPDQETLQEAKREIQGWLWSRWLHQSKSLFGKAEPWAEEDPDFYPEMWFPTNQESLAPLSWAPHEDQIAILYDGLIYAFKYLPDQAEYWREEFGERSVYREMGGFLPIDQVDLAGFEIENLDFWDGQTLLAWGRVGLFEVKLELKGRP